MAIPSIQGAHLLDRMLPTLRFRPANVVVLDQGSTDDTARVCAAAGVELMQLGHPHTYTEACNIGARLAHQRDVPFLCVANNDIVFCTDVMAELLAEMDRDPRLGIVAPSQVILDPAHGIDVLARRVHWNLDTVEFLHDLDSAPLLPRLEADFCELTCVLIRISAIQEVGFLDDAYGFYYEDADFCFRLRRAGYGAAYLPRSQIHHRSSSSFSGRRQAQLDYQRRNRIRFAYKHLGLGVRRPSVPTTGPNMGIGVSEAETVARRLDPVLRQFGLIDDDRPNLVFGRAAPQTLAYLLTPLRATTIPASWPAARDRVRAILTTSDAVVSRLSAEGLAGFRTPLGIDPDVFHPWGVTDGPAARGYDEATWLVIATAYDRRPFSALLQAWVRFVSVYRSARLIVVGSCLGFRMGRPADTAYRSGNFEISWYAAERVELHETIAPQSDAELAHLYRSVDFTVVTEAEGSGLTMLESLACGTPVVFDPRCAAVAALHRDATGGGILPQAGEPAPVDGSGNAEGLLAALEASAQLDAGARRALAMAGHYGVLGHSTLRHTAMALRHALEATQTREPERFVWRLEAQPVPVADPGRAPSAAVAARRRLSGVMAHGLTTAATASARFGTAWQQRGLSAAVIAAGPHLRSALRRLAVSRPVAVSRPGPASATAAQPVNACLAVGSGPPPARQASPLLIGYIDAQLGIGQSLRGLAFSLAEVGTPFGIYPFGVGVEGRRTVPTMTERYDKTTPHDVNIIEVSPAELPNVFAHVSADHFDGSYNILRTYWELARGPAAWREGHGMDRIDEIWAPNAFCAAAFADFFDGPIAIIPPCLDIAGLGTQPGTAEAARALFGLTPGTFHFMFSFDYYSFPERKNPLAVVRAFLAAFAEFDRPVELVVKASSVVGHFPAIKRQIAAAAEADGRITLIDASLSRDDMVSLMAGIDCYVSLHRAEGFGLGMAEAMALGKPVIATGYSGNAEFVTEATAYPIPYTLVPIGPGEYVQATNQVWADPDEAACAAAMRAVVDRPAAAAARANAGRAFVEGRYGAANVGRIATERLDAIRAARRPLTAA